MHISKHAKKRLKERCGFNKKSQKRIVQKAFEEGITHKQTKGSLNRWITSLYFNNKKASNIKIYGDKAYIFCDEILVTVIQIPTKMRKNFKNMIKKDG